jgi:glutathione S-transferase
VIPEDARLAAQVEQVGLARQCRVRQADDRQYVVGYAFPKEPGKPDMAAIKARGREDEAAGRGARPAVASTGHLVGDSLTARRHQHPADAVYVNRFEEGKALLGAAKNLSAYMDRHFARDSFRKSAPPPRQ